MLMWLDFFYFLAINYRYHITCHLAVVNYMKLYEKIRGSQFYIIAIWHSIAESQDKVLA